MSPLTTPRLNRLHVKQTRCQYWFVQPTVRLGFHHGHSALAAQFLGTAQNLSGKSPHFPAFHENSLVELGNFHVLSAVKLNMENRLRTFPKPMGPRLSLSAYKYGPLFLCLVLLALSLLPKALSSSTVQITSQLHSTSKSQWQTNRHFVPSQRSSNKSAETPDYLVLISPVREKFHVHQASRECFGPPFGPFLSPPRFLVLRI